MPSSGSYGMRRNVSRLDVAPNKPNRPSTEISRSQTATATAQDDQAKQDKTRRVIAYYTHALVTLHAFGIPLSAGLTLEYYFNNCFVTTPLANLGLIFGIQWIGIFAMEPLAAVMFRWKHWRRASISVAVITVLCHAVMARGTRLWTLTLGMRALLGVCLGFLRSVTLRCLASHYNDDIAGSSMQSGAAAMLGAVFYSLIAWVFLRRDNYKNLAWANFYIVLFTLTPALAGLFRAPMLENIAAGIPRQKRSMPILRHHKSARTMQSQHEFEEAVTQTNPKLALVANSCSLGGYVLIFAFVFVWPTFFPLLFSSRPIYEYPEYADYWLIGSFAAATFTATLFAHPWPRRGLGVVNAFTAAGIFAGSLLLIAAWTPNFWVWGVISVLYGFCLGPLLALHRKVLDLSCKYRTTTVPFPAGLGILAFGGIGLSSFMIQKSGSGSLALTVSGAAMVVGGCCMMVGSWLKYPKKYVVI
ncbi:hypothetical protein BU23DRAFT_604757 [Bimuria novae-zelandiae CBS 107.79]|uniref:MFS general substrate transporter n=1 Tax=Bimuria novae-zelandiae CBS 107.79 TaxID=1447943 RepID=A0A6A5UIM1_9PLEO|nr:hypothetical protein BU23DRAFT_604757 [Bimuria novae-zelandiae CBS 107.79]